MPKNPMNEKPFEHHTLHGTRFVAARCDFVGGVVAHLMRHDLSEKDLLSDVAEMIGFHSVNIISDLNGFAGYDCIDFTIDRPAPNDMPINELGLSMRVENLLQNKDYDTLEKICRATESELRHIHGFGMKAILEVKAVLTSMGRHLKEH